MPHGSYFIYSFFLDEVTSILPSYTRASPAPTVRTGTPRIGAAQMRTARFGKSEGRVGTAGGAPISSTRRAPFLPRTWHALCPLALRRVRTACVVPMPHGAQVGTAAREALVPTSVELFRSFESLRSFEPFELC